MTRWACGGLCVAALFAALVTPAGSVVAYAKDGIIWLTTPDGSRQHRVTLDDTAGAPYRSPSHADDGTWNSGAAREPGAGRARALGRHGSRVAHTVLPPSPARQPARPGCKRNEIAIGAPGEMRFCQRYNISTFKASLSGGISNVWQYPRQWHGVVGCYTHYFSGSGAADHIWIGRTPGRFLLNSPPGTLQVRQVRIVKRKPVRQVRYVKLKPVTRVLGVSAERAMTEYTNTCGFENYTEDASPDCGTLREENSDFDLSLAWDEGVLGIRLRHPGLGPVHCDPHPPDIPPPALPIQVSWHALNNCKLPTISASGTKTLPWAPDGEATGHTVMKWNLTLQRLRCVRPS